MSENPVALATDTTAKRVAELEAALEPFSALNVELEKLYADYPDYSVLLSSGFREITHKDFRRARAALHADKPAVASTEGAS